MAGYAVTYSVVDNATKNIDAINKRMAALRAPMERMSKSVSRFVDVSGLRKVAQGFDWIWKSAANVLRTLTQIVPAMAGITGAATIAGLFKLVDGFAAWSRNLSRRCRRYRDRALQQETQKLWERDAARGRRRQRYDRGPEGPEANAVQFEHEQRQRRGNRAATQQMGDALRERQRNNVKSWTRRRARAAANEHIKQLGAIKDPTDRARAANELLGASGNKLVESFRQSTMGIDAAIDAANKYGTLTRR